MWQIRVVGEAMYRGVVGMGKADGIQVVCNVSSCSDRFPQYFESDVRLEAHGWGARRQCRWWHTHTRWRESTIVSKLLAVINCRVNEGLTQGKEACRWVGNRADQEVA